MERLSVDVNALVGTPDASVDVPRETSQAVSEQVRPLLRLWGMGRRERDADPLRIPTSIGNLLPPSATALTNGILPTTGFGLSGTAGVGKTMAIAALLKAYVRKSLEREYERDGQSAFQPQRLNWLAWPDTVNQLRVLSTQDGGLVEAERIVHKAVTAPALVVDDLGAERIKGNYLDDWSASQLDLIVDGRHRECRPIWWTTNLPMEDFLKRYGSRLFSRLCSDNPLLTIPERRDLRMAKP